MGISPVQIFEGSWHDFVTRHPVTGTSVLDDWTVIWWDNLRDRQIMYIAYNNKMCISFVVSERDWIFYREKALPGAFLRARADRHAEIEDYKSYQGQGYY